MNEDDLDDLFNTILYELKKEFTYEEGRQIARRYTNQLILAYAKPKKEVIG